MPFYNQYHFVPVANAESPQSLSFADWNGNRPVHLLHDRFGPHGETDTGRLFTGRMICIVRTESPSIIGASQKRERGQPTEVVWPMQDGRPFIPGSTLRGMISSVAEAASNSALRVLAPSVADDNALPCVTSDPDGFPAAMFAAINPNLLPLGRIAAKTRLTLAELLFGFVSESDRFPDQRLAFASRVRCSNAQLVSQGDPWLCPESRILCAMKAPNALSAALYFEEIGARNPRSHIGKNNLTPRTHRPRGRKRYLHVPEAALLTDAQWNHVRENARGAGRDEPMEAHLKARPVKNGCDFLFHLDFTNLTRLELGLLCYAVLPESQFRHKLGLGKPLGLGGVLVGRQGMFLVDPSRRYLQDDLHSLHYHWARHAERVDPQSWPQPLYRHEADAFHRDLASPLPKPPAPADLANEFRAMMERLAPDCLYALEKLGRKTALSRSVPVRYLVPSQTRSSLPPLGDASRATWTLPECE